MAKKPKSIGGTRKRTLADRTSFNFGANVRRRGGSKRRGGKGGGS
jgi:hypothetical protein